MLTPKSGLLGRRLAAHLLRRASYNARKSRIDEFANYTVQQAMDVLMTPSTPQYREPRFWNAYNFYPRTCNTENPEICTYPIEGEEFLSCGTLPSSCEPYTGNAGTSGRQMVKSWWMNEATKDTSMLRKLQHFLHTCIMPSMGAGENGYWPYGFDGFRCLEHFAFGSYRDLAKKIPFMPGMMSLLNIDLSSADNPNENFAREFLELYTLGRGEQVEPGNYTTYTEDDIIEAAKIFTGLRWLSNVPNAPFIDSDLGTRRGYPIYNYHDTTDKTFSAAFNHATITGAVDEADVYREVEDFVDLIFDQDHTALYLCRRMYRFFVHNKITPEIEQNIIVPLADTFRNSDYNMETVLRELLSSEHFYGEDQANPENYMVGGMIGNHLEVVLLTMSRFEIERPDMATATHDFYEPLRFVQDNMNGSGMNPFGPPTVAGHPAYFQAPQWSRLWFTSDTVAARLNLGIYWVVGLTPYTTWVQNNISNPYDSRILLEETVDIFFPETPPIARLDYFHQELFLRNMDPSDWSLEWSNYINTSDDTEVSLILRYFFIQFLKAIECQLV